MSRSDWVWILIFALLMLGLWGIFMGGCAGSPGQKAKAGGDVDQKQQESAVETGSARDVATYRYGLSAEQLALEEQRLLENRIDRASDGLIIVGVLLIAAAAPSFFPTWLKPWVYAAGVAAIVSSQFLPLLITLAL